MGKERAEPIGEERTADGQVPQCAHEFKGLGTLCHTRKKADAGGKRPCMQRGPQAKKRGACGSQSRPTEHAHKVATGPYVSACAACGTSADSDCLLAHQRAMIACEVSTRVVMGGSLDTTLTLRPHRHGMRSLFGCCVWRMRRLCFAHRAWHAKSLQVLLLKGHALLVSLSSRKVSHRSLTRT